MAKRFSFVIEVDKKDNIIPHIYLKDKAADAQSLFFELRNKGVEAYYFQHPRPDKHSKSLEQKAASAGTSQAANPAPVPEAKPEEAPKKKGNKIFGLGFGG